MLNSQKQSLLHPIILMISNKSTYKITSINRYKELYKIMRFQIIHWNKHKIYKNQSYKTAI